MKLSEFWKGRVVFWSDYVGHVTGFGQNAQREVLIKVKPLDFYKCGEMTNEVNPEFYIHQSNLSFEQPEHFE